MTSNEYDALLKQSKAITAACDEIDNSDHDPTEEEWKRLYEMETRFAETLVETPEGIAFKFRVYTEGHHPDGVVYQEGHHNLGHAFRRTILEGLRRIAEEAS